MSFKTIVWVLSFSVISSQAMGVEFTCQTVNKYSSLGKEAQENLVKYQYSSKLSEKGTTAVYSRCSFETAAGKITCDDYQVDKIVEDSNINAKKYYYFRGQADLQIFKDLTAVENNGRGQISYQKCKVTAP